MECGGKGGNGTQRMKNQEEGKQLKHHKTSGIHGISVVSTDELTAVILCKILKSFSSSTHEEVILEQTFYFLVEHEVT